MAGLFCSLKTNGAISVTATTAKTIIQLVAPSGAGVRVTRFHLDPSGASPTATKGTWELVKSATGGSGNSSRAPVKSHGHTGSVTATGQQGYTSDPSGGTVIDSGLVHEQGSINIPREILLNPSETLGLRVTMANSISVAGGFNFEE